VKRRTRTTQHGAKPWKYATLISIVVTLIAVAGLVVSFLTGKVLWGIVLLLPTAAYEAYRTGGETTRWASWAMLILLVATVVLVVLGINYDLRNLLGQQKTTIAGQTIPLGDVKMVMPALMGVCALILLIRTRGRFTKWLALVIFVAAVAIVYLIDPIAMRELLRQGLSRIN
jgi:membrane-associated HD superfamily phosphohydrolase